MIEYNCTIPVQRHEGPGKGARDNWDVDESRVRAVTEVEE